MEWNIIKNDLRRNKMINFTLLLFMMLATILAVSSTVMAVQTITSVNRLYEVAEPPHFLQMHKGDVDQAEIDAFMAEQDQVVDWQTITMINVYGENISVIQEDHQFDLSDTQLDIGLVTQPDQRDLLLDAQHQRIELSPGQIAMPIILKDPYGLEIGDRITISDENTTAEFVLTDFVLDAQMNSTLASSTRILLSEEDYQTLAGQIGEYEHLIEAYFTDSNLASSFQTTYEDADLPRNGQAVTYTMMFLLSAFTDLTTVFLMLVVSIILILIAFICLRFVITVALEEDITEIGVLKAIGFTNQGIRQLYLGKYRFLALIATILGFIMAILLSSSLTNRINTTFGEMSLTALALSLGVLTAVVIYALIMLFCRRSLMKIRHLSVVDALVSGKGFAKDTKGRLSRDGLGQVKLFPLNWRMSGWEVFFQFKEWAIVAGVVLLAILLMIFPLNLLTTLHSPGFAAYMGNDFEDVLVEIENNAQLESNYLELIPILEEHPDIASYRSYRGISAPTVTPSNEKVNIHIDSGEDAGQGLQYLEGQAPASPQEIALSFMNAERLEKGISDSVILDSQEFIISGIYQDVTSGGYTAKTTYPFEDLASNKYTISLALKVGVDAKVLSEQLADQVGQGVNIAPMAEFLQQTLGSVTQQIQGLILVIIGVGLFMAILITVLFLQLRLTRDQASIATLKAIGFTNGDVKNQYLLKVSMITIVGIIVGLILTMTSSNFIINQVLGLLGLGIKEVELIMNPFLVYIVVPVMMLVVVGITTYLVSRRINHYQIVNLINE